MNIKHLSNDQANKLRDNMHQITDGRWGLRDLAETLAAEAKAAGELPDGVGQISPRGAPVFEVVSAWVGNTMCSQYSKVLWIADPRKKSNSLALTMLTVVSKLLGTSMAMISLRSDGNVTYAWLATKSTSATGRSRKAQLLIVIK